MHYLPSLSSQRRRRAFREMGKLQKEERVAEEEVVRLHH